MRIMQSEELQVLNQILEELKGKNAPDTQQKFAFCTTDNAAALEALLDRYCKGRYKRFTSVNNGIYEYILSIPTDVFEQLKSEAQNTGVAAYFDTKRIPISGSITSAAVTIGNVDIYGWDGAAWQAIQLDASKNLKVTWGGGNSANITTATTTTVKASAGTLKKIIVGKAVAASTVIFKDGTTVLGTLDSAAVRSEDLNIACATSIVIVTSHATDVTVVYS